MTVRCSVALATMCFGMVTVEEGEGSCEGTTVVLVVLVVLPTLAGDGMGEKLGGGGGGGKRRS